MKSQIKRFSKSSISVVLCLCMLITCVTAGIITTDAAKIDTSAATDAAASGEAVGAAVPDDDSVGRGAGYILYGTSDNPSQWSDTGANVTLSGTKYTAIIPKSKFSSSGTNYFIGISSSTNVSNMFFQSGSITVSTTGAWFSDRSSQSRDNYRFARIKFATVPTADIILEVDTNGNTYKFSYNAGTTTTYTVTVSAQTGGKVVINGATINSGSSSNLQLTGTQVSIVATPQTGYAFDGWVVTGGASIAALTNPSTAASATADGTITAKFKDASTTKRIYFDNSSANWSQPYAYTYDSNNTFYGNAWPGNPMTLYKGKIWCVDVNIAATKVIFNQGNSTNQTSPLTIPTNLSRPTYYRHMGTNASWGEYEDISTGNKKYVTSPINNQSSVELYTDIDATFYDYYTDGEYKGNYYEDINAATEGWVNGISERYPYKQFDKSLSEYAEKNSVDYPMYYLAGYYNQNNEGDRYHPGGWYNEGSWNSGYGRYINDSNQLGGNTKAVTGLSGLTLADGIIHHYKSGDTNQNGVPMAMFDEDWLTSRSQGTFASNNDKYTYGGELATMIYSKFPVRKTTTPSGYNRIYLDTSNQAWWANDNRKIIAHLWNNATDFVDIEMTKEANNFYSVECTGFNSVLFYRGTKFGEYNNQTYNLSIPASNSTNRTYVVNSQSGNYCGGYWTGTSSYYYNRDYDAGGQTYYEFDSTGGKDNIWFDDPTSNHPTMYYGSGSGYAVKNGYNGKSSFMPFDRCTDNHISGKTGVGKDLGMGMKLEINFTLGRDFSGTPQTNSNYGKETGQVITQVNNQDQVHDQVFKFSGDDDLWVFVDDKLILDLGGAHAVTQGSINFATKTVTTNPTPYTGVNSVSRNGSFTLDDKEVHKMTIYYTERGMHESNLKFGFSFAPVETDLKVDKKVDYADVNDGGDPDNSALVADVRTVAANDTFTISQSYDSSSTSTAMKANDTVTPAGVTPIANKTYAYTTSQGTSYKDTSASGTYVLKDGETARFTNVLDKNTYLDKYFRIKEEIGASNFYSYTPSLKVTDRVTGQVLPTKQDLVYIQKDGTGYYYTYQDGTPILDQSRNRIYVNAYGAQTNPSQYGVEYDADNNPYTVPTPLISSYGATFKYNNDKGRHGTNATGAAVTGDMTPVNVDASFTNRITTHNLVLSKLVLDNLGKVDGNVNDTFTFKVEIDVDGSRTGFNYKTYTLTYYGDHSGTIAGTGDNAGKVTLKDGEYIIIPGIPEKARVRVTEVNMPSQYEYYSIDTMGATKGGDLSNGAWFTMTSDADVEINNIVWTYEFIYHYPSRLVYYEDNWSERLDAAGSYAADPAMYWDDLDLPTSKKVEDDNRIWGDEMEYTIDGVFDQDFANYLQQYPINDGIVKFYMPGQAPNGKQDITWVVQNYSPYVDNFKETLEWDLRTAIDYGKYYSPNHPERDHNASYPIEVSGDPADISDKPITIETDEENKEVTVHVYADIDANFNVNLDIMLPYNYTKTDNGFVYVYSSDDTVTYRNTSPTYSDIVRFEHRYSESTSVTDQFIEAPECINNGGNIKHFYYWKVYKRGDLPSDATREFSEDDDKVFRKCYNNKFNLACYEDYTIYPYYGLDEHMSSQDRQTKDRGGAKFANITWLENSRNQWNYNGGGKVGDEHHQNDAANTAKWQNYGDRLFTDFVVEYGYDNLLLSEQDLYNDVRTGIVIERVCELESYYEPLDDEMVVDADPNSSRYDDNKAAANVNAAAHIKTYVSSGFTTRNGRALLHSDFNYKDLDNKNMIEQYYSFANYYQKGTSFTQGVAPDQQTFTANTQYVAEYPTTLRNYLYRAYAYIKADLDEPVYISTPVYFTIYSEATRGNVSENLYE